MDKKTEDPEARALLEQVVAAKKQDVLTSRITAIAVVILVTALLVCLALTVPSLVRTIKEAHTTLSQTQELIQRANTSLDALDEMTGSISGVMEAGAEKIDQVTKIFSSFDLESFGDTLQKLSAALETLSGFRLFG